jgi:hypothetical protein
VKKVRLLRLVKMGSEPLAGEYWRGLAVHEATLQDHAEPQDKGKCRAVRAPLARGANSTR